MKKIILLSLLVLGSLTFTETVDEIQKSVANLDNVIRQIEAREEQKFLQEQAKASAAAQRIQEDSMLLSKTETLIAQAHDAKEFSFYSKDYDSVISDLHALSSDLEKSISMNQEIVDAFEEFRAIIGR